MVLSRMPYLDRRFWPTESSYSGHYVIASLDLMTGDRVCFQVFRIVPGLPTSGQADPRQKVEPDNYQSIGDLARGGRLVWEGVSGQMLWSIPSPWFGKVARLAMRL